MFNEFIQNTVDSLDITESIKVTEQIVKQHKGFANKESIHVKVTVKKGHSTIHLVELFKEKKTEKDGRIKEGSRISFLKPNNFPDGCYYTIKKDSNIIDCYICELKHTPGHKVQTIAKQFYVAYIHCKTIFAAVKLDERYDIRYHFGVYGFNKYYEKFENQPIVNGAIKTPPGVRPASIPELRAYENYKKGKIYFSYTTDFSETDPFQFQFNYFQLELDKNATESTIVNLQYELEV